MPPNEPLESHPDNRHIYSPEYESDPIRGVDEPRPWDLREEIELRINSTSRILDIGCGTAAKIIPFAAKTREVIGLEPSESMRVRAAEHIRASFYTNVRVVDGSADNLPFESQSFDVVTDMLAPDNPEEVFRVLKPGGYAIIEKLGERDKANLKSFFGSDDEGMRGQLGNLKVGERAASLRKSYLSLFDKVTVTEGKWNTYYSHIGLIMLLENTPVIRGFDIEKDAQTLEEAERALNTPRGILVPQHRILIIAQK